MHKVAQDIFFIILTEKREELHNLERYRKSSMRDVHQASHAMESRYDTFREESQYLANAFTRQQADLGRIISLIQTALSEKHDTSVRIMLGSLVTITNIETDEDVFYVFVPDGTGGNIYHRDDINIKAASVTAPISRQFIAKEVGDLISVRSKGVSSEWEITEIR